MVIVTAKLFRMRKDGKGKIVMLKIASLIWIVLGTALAGTAMLAVLNIASLADQGMKLIPLAVLCGFVIAMPLSYLVARRIGRPAAG